MDDGGLQCALPTQVAAAMLAARAEGKTSPLQTMLPVEAGAAAMLAWQQAVRTRSAKKVKEYQREVWLLVRKMGMQVRGEAGPGRGGLRAWKEPSPLLAERVGAVIHYSPVTRDPKIMTFILPRI